MLSRCDACNGLRWIIGMGGMRKDCDMCKGVGFVKLVDAIAATVKQKRKYTFKNQEVI